MDSNFINQITMDCLINRKQKEKIDNKSNNLFLRKDKKFYRRRILNLTKEMLLNSYSEEVLPDVKNAFENYVKTCIGYFKIKDEMDIIQKDYQTDSLLDELTKNELDEDDIVSPEEADKLMMRSIKINHLTLDKFVKIKQLKPIKPMIIPQQKDINLQDPSLKKKGIVKKNNLHPSYKGDEEDKKEKSI